MEIKSGMFRLVQLSRVIWYPPGSWNGTGAAVIAARLSDTFNDEPLIMPIPLQAPPEIPRCILKANNGARELHISLDRVVDEWNLFTSDVNHVPPVEETRRAFQVIADHANLRIVRFGTSCARVLTVDEPAVLVAKFFCLPEHLSDHQGAKGPFNRPESFEIHAHKIYSPPGISGVPMNSWMRIKTGKAMIYPNAAPTSVVVAQQELNTLEDEDGESGAFGLPFDRLSEIYNTMSHELEAIMNRYFPDGI